MTAILQDWKGFRKSVDIPRPIPIIRIPIYNMIRPEYEPAISLPSPYGQFEHHEITFRLIDWIEKNEVALYRQEA
mgnify:CR=1 FL=1